MRSMVAKVFDKRNPFTAYAGWRKGVSRNSADNLSGLGGVTVTIRANLSRTKEMQLGQPFPF
jgi:hypothetical protein